MVMRASATPQVQSGTMHAALTMDKCVSFMDLAWRIVLGRLSGCIMYQE